MTHVEGEPVLLGQRLGRPVEKVRVEVDDLAAQPALDVTVGVSVDQVVGGRAVPEVDVLERSEVGERLEGAMNAVAVDAGVQPGHRRHDGVRGQVPVVARESREDGATWSGHPLAASP